MKQDLKKDIEDLIAAGVADDLSSEEIAGNVLSAIEVEAVLARSHAQDAGASDPIAWIKATYLMWLKGDLEPEHMRLGQNFFDARRAAAARTPAGKDNLTEADLRQVIDNRDYLIFEYEKQLQQLRAQVETVSACAQFVKWALQEGPWQGGDLDGGSIQDKAEELGLIRKVPYDPEKHGESEFGAESGSDWYVLADPVAAMSHSSTVSLSNG